MKSVQDVVTIIGSILALISTLLAILKGFRDLKKSPGSGATSHDGQKLAAATWRDSRLDDLGILLLVGAALSLVAIGVLVVPYFAGSVGWMSGGASMACSVIIVGLLIGSWQVGAEFVSISIVSGFLLLIRCVSAGGTFRDAGTEGVGVAATVIEVCALLLICVVALRHTFARPVGSTTSARVGPSFAITVPILLASAAIAAEFVVSAEQDPLAPKALNASAKAAVDELSTASQRPVLVALYRLASEVALEDKYRDASTRATLSPRRSDSTKARAEDDEVLSFLKDKQPKPPGLVATIPIVFDLQSLDEKTRYLRSRLMWVYPVAKSGAQSSPFSLPGTDAEMRLRTLSDTRAHVALLSQRQIQEEFIAGGIRYSPSIMASFGKTPMEDPVSAMKQLMGSMFGADVNGRLSQETLEVFPYRELAAQTAQFGGQMALPLSDDLVIAHHQYRSYARDSLKASEPTTSLFLSRIDGLPEKTQVRIEQLLSASDRPGELLASIAVLEGLSGEPKIQVQGATTLLRLADALRGQAEQASGDSRDPLLEKFQAQVVALLASLPDERSALADALQREARLGAMATDLFYGELPKTAKDLKSNFEAKIRTKLIDCLAHPVRSATQRLAVVSGTDLESRLANFVGMSSADQQVLLHHLALKVYKNDGEHALSPLKQIVLQAFAVSKYLGYAIAFLAALPLAVLITGIAIWGERALTARAAIANGSVGDGVKELDRLLPREPTKLAGRVEFLSRVDRLMNKASSAIAFTGRRGSGKSRLLREVYRSAVAGGRVAVWLDCPSKYGQEELLRAMVEKLASSAEATAAKAVGLPNYNERSVERVRATQTWNISLILVLIVMFIGGSNILQSSRSDTFALWFPLVPILIAAGAAVLFGGRSISASPTFAEVFARSRNYQLSALFSRSAGLLRELAYEGIRREGLYTALTALRATALVVLGLVILQQLTSLVFYKSPGILAMLIPMPSATEQLAGVLVFVLLWLIVYLHRIEPPLIRRWNNLAMVELYRDLSTEIVSRSRRAGLVSDGPSVVVCVDELDKVADQAELVSLIKVMKPLLDIDGVVFYFSIAEDALTMLRLGVISGKDIFDSTFDHIERVPPVTLKAAVSIADEYLKSIFSERPQADVVQSIAMLSMGVPRDIVRFGDEIRALPEGNLRGRDVVKVFRTERMMAARSSGLITQTEVERLTASATEALTFGSHSVFLDQNIARTRLFAFGLILAWFELAVSVDAAGLAGRFEVAYQFGYEIPLLSGEEIVAWMRSRVAFLISAELHGKDAILEES